MSFNKYLQTIKKDFRAAIKVEWLNYDESVAFEFTDSLYDINVNLNVNYQNGCRRTCTLVLNNDNNEFPIDFNHIWIGQKFKLWMGIYINDKTPYLLPQGVFYVSNPNEIYNPSTRTITINGIDKWGYLDGTLFGKLSGTYKTNVDVNLYSAIRSLLQGSNGQAGKKYYITEKNIYNIFSVKNKTYFFEGNGSIFTSNNKGVGGSSNDAKTILEAKSDIDISFAYSYSSENSYDKFYLTVGANVIEDGVSGKTTQKSYSGHLHKGEKIVFEYIKDNANNRYDDVCSFSNMIVFENRMIDPVPPLLSTHFIGKQSEIYTWDEEQGKYVKNMKDVLLCPYTATVERGNTLADVLLEYATILCANIYYDVHGRLILEPMIDTADDITDTNKEILWDYTVDEQTFLGLTQTYNFDKIYNDIIVLGNITNGYQFKGRVQNRNPLSNTCIQKIGLKTKEPIEDNQYVSDEQCVELAKYYAKIDTILQKSGTIDSVTLFHLDVNKLVTISTPNNNMSKELFLITGFSLSPTGTMSVNVTSVNVLKDFSVVEAEVIE